MFQPLIGTIKTNLGTYLYQALAKFQPLIGTIKTYKQFFPCYKSHFVSTPYRDDKNSRSKSISNECSYKVSTPYRDDKNV